ncbi:MAG: hypothetical protein ACLR0U_14805 [Enterocloster clostridioformis]
MRNADIPNLIFGRAHLETIASFFAVVVFAGIIPNSRQALASV